MRRNKLPGPTVNLEHDMTCKLKKEDFLSNEKNKESFLKLLGQNLENSGHTVYHSSGDADCLIVKTALESAQNTTTVLISNDTDLLVLLLRHAEPNGHDLYFKPETKIQSKKGQRTWNVRNNKQALGDSICKHLLFMYAMLGSDTTSRVQGIGKGSILKKASNESFCDVANTFLQESSNQDVINSGEKAMIMIYGESNTRETSLDALRHNKFKTKTATSVAAVKLSSLPPTSTAMAFYSQRVYYQVQQWKGNISLN